MSQKLPIINCHTHIFTGDHVPPYLAKTFLPFPFYYLLPLSLIVRIFRFWYSGPYRWQFKPWFKNLSEIVYQGKMIAVRYGLGRFLSFAVGAFLAVHVFYILYDWFVFLGPEETYTSYVAQLKAWLERHSLLFIPPSLFSKLTLTIIFLLFFKTGRNILFAVIKKLWSFLAVVPGPESKALANRYLNLGRYALHTNQAEVFKRLKAQYPKGSKFIVLPMDMEYMSAGKPKTDFRYFKQMEELKELKEKSNYKDILYPFVFADPRRMVAEGADHFDYTIQDHKVILNDCFIKTYIEGSGFSGFKIYPALGYYPFDEALLPLWKYAADHGLPILTHCIRGTIYYRGNKERSWDYHPVFEQANVNGTYKLMLLKETKNKDFCNNFTHPLNYLCLLEEELLRKLVHQAKDDKIRALFGFTDLDTPLKANLRNLKLCFGHFGGDDEWNRYMELDRDNYAKAIIQNPNRGIVFMKNNNGEYSPAKLEQIWKYVDWYSIICSMMLQFDHVYADLSYIIHNPSIQPLLKQTLLNENLKTRVLFGTDFYVVRNHKSEKNMIADMSDQLTEAEFNLIARTNPNEFLRKAVQGH